MPQGTSNSTWQLCVGNWLHPRFPLLATRRYPVPVVTPAFRYIYVCVLIWPRIPFLIQLGKKKKLGKKTRKKLGKKTRKFGLLFSAEWSSVWDILTWKRETGSLWTSQSPFYLLGSIARLIKFYSPVNGNVEGEGTHLSLPHPVRGAQHSLASCCDIQVRNGSNTSDPQLNLSSQSQSGE